jgi:hypothetical protein
MTTKIKCFEVPDPTVRCFDTGPDGNDGSGIFELNDNEKAFFDSIAQEQIDIAGTVADFFSQQVEQSTRDPLYDEPTERVWSQPYRIKVWVAWPQSAPVVGEHGFKFEFTGQAWIPRKTLEDANAPAPFEGDVLRFWKLPFFDDFGVARDKRLTNKGWFFDVTNSDPDGHINDTATFVGFKLDLKRRSEFGAERRILPP